ncbi:clavesin-1 [Bradysia coprophila]|uniref:clavesin-1 n=1 Tax=Bradysia coprophila TaxID=38358 RepID=UPI00187DA10C|nr:clavesin-1 [Bradysia coprophila]
MMSALLDDNSIVLTDLQHEVIEQLRELMKNDYRHIRFQQDVNFLTKFLYANDWNAEEALNKIVNSYRLKKDFPEWFATKKVSEYLPIIQMHSRYMLADRDRNGKRIFVYKGDKMNTPRMNLRMSAQLDDMWYDAMLMDTSTQCNGLTVIADAKNTPKSIIKWLKPSDVRVSSERANVFPCKNLEVHVVNISPLVNIAIKVIMPLLNDRVKSKLHFHQNDWTMLHKFIDKDCLPEEFGGPPGSKVDYEKSYKFLLDKESSLEESMQHGII